MKKTILPMAVAAMVVFLLGIQPGCQRETPTEQAQVATARSPEQAAPAGAKLATDPPRTKPPKTVAKKETSLSKLDTNRRTGDLETALAKLESRVGGWRYNPPQDYERIRRTGIDLAKAMVAADNRTGAVQALSAVGRASRDPVGFLYELQSSLDDDLREAIWPQEPYLVLEDFESPISKPIDPIFNTQKRQLVASSIEAADPSGDGHWAHARVGASTHSGRSGLAVLRSPGFRVSDKPFGIRARVKEKNPIHSQLFLRFWLPGPQKNFEWGFAPVGTLEDEWELFDTGREFLHVKDWISNASGRDAEQTTLTFISLNLPQGDENELWVDDVQVYIPANWESLENTTSESLPKGKWVPHRRGPSLGSPQQVASADLTAQQQQQLESLRAIGYLGSTDVVAAGEDEYVYHAKDAAYEGYNFYVSGHSPTAFLTDMDGNVLHTWEGDYPSLWASGKPPEGVERQGTWRRAHLLEDGSILAIHEGRALVKLDKDSNVVWANRGGYHHDLFVMDDGTVYVLTREPKVDPRFNNKKPILEDFITILDSDGNVLRNISILESFENSHHASSSFKRLRDSGDIYHTNTIEVLDGRLADRSPAFKKGNVLISVKYMHNIAVVDLDQEKVVWSLSGMWLMQHQPTVLDNGRMLIFDNCGLHWGQRGGEQYSRVLEFDPFSQEVVWEYRGTHEAPFYSLTCGSCQRLPNGNTLISETDNGRAFEVNPEGDIVWSLTNPHRAGENNSFIAGIFECIRLDPDFPLDWLQ